MASARAVVTPLVAAASIVPATTATVNNCRFIFRFSLGLVFVGAISRDRPAWQVTPSLMLGADPLPGFCRGRPHVPLCVPKMLHVDSLSVPMRERSPSL
jgi:hypothetical protein